jgi:hypothetical protein
MDRYTTWEQAETGHAAMVERCKAASADTPGERWWFTHRQWRTAMCRLRVLWRALAGEEG